MSAVSASSLASPSHRVTVASTTAVKPSVVLTARVLYTAIFILSGLTHFSSQVVGYAASAGVPFASLAVPAAGILAVAGGLSILLGYRAKIGAWAVVLFLVPVTLMMHNFWAVKDPMMHQMQFVMFMKNLALIGGALLISQFGSGPWSLDDRQN
jgi:putative oxidoreductase